MGKPNRKHEEVNKRLQKIRDLEEIMKPFELVYRDEWDTGPVTDGQELVKVETQVSTAVIPALKHPIGAALFSYTQTPTCGGFEECQKYLQAICLASRKKGLPDIPYSFAVGGDGKVYECRGWMKKPEINENFPQLDGAVIDVAYFGETGQSPPMRMANAGWELVQYGVMLSFMKNQPQYYTDYKATYFRKR